MANIVYFGAGNIFYNLFDDGIANVLGLETLRHGTNPLNNLSLRISGGNPNYGGSSVGSTKNFSSKDAKNHFYVFKDNKFNPYTPINNRPTTERIATFVVERGFNRILPRMHAALSGSNLAARYVVDMTKKASSLFIRYFKVFVCCIAALTSLIISPTVRFRFSRIDPKRLENDPDYGGIAYRTTQVIEPWRIGLIGSLITGLNFDWFSRIKANPMKILTGVAQLACSIAIAVLCINTVVATPVLLIPGITGAVLA